MVDNSNLAEYSDDYQTPHGEKKKEWHQATQALPGYFQTIMSIQRGGRIIRVLHYKPTSILIANSIMGKNALTKHRS